MKCYYIWNSLSSFPYHSWQTGRVLNGFIYQELMWLSSRYFGIAARLIPLCTHSKGRPRHLTWLVPRTGELCAVQSCTSPCTIRRSKDPLSRLEIWPKNFRTWDFTRLVRIYATRPNYGWPVRNRINTMEQGLFSLIRHRERIITTKRVYIDLLFFFFSSSNYALLDTLKII